MKKNKKEKSPRKDGMTRRSFLKGISGGALGGTLLPTGLLGVQLASAEAAETQTAVKALGPGIVPIELNINGQTYKTRVDIRTTLLSAIRDHLDLTGTKEVCDRGACGGCTVLLDGKPITSCMMLAIEAQGHKIETIEGLADGDHLHPVQEAFIAHDALQCGFCTPAMIMTIKSLLDRKPNPTLDDVRHATAGNLCRCGAYNKVFEAALAASKMKT
ncbi:MAG: (2Fe-2S)-binding protein [bacterium]